MQCKSILVVEDDQSIRETLKMALEVEGYAVELAANGQEGIDAVRRADSVCLILLDLMMPVLDGFEFLSLRQDDPAMAKIPVVVISAFPEKASRTQTAQGFVRKPIELEALLSFVHQYCG